MNEKQNKISKLLWDFHSLREEQVLKICQCNKDDIDLLIAYKVLVREKTGVIRHRMKDINNRNIVAFDVVMEYLDRNPEIIKAKFPVNVTLITKYMKYDIIAIKESEMQTLYDEIDIIYKADKTIIIIETNNYMKRKINTNRECLVCTFPPLKIVEKIN